MKWRPQPPGGWWDMYLKGRTASVRYDGQNPSAFDGLYIGEEVEGGQATYPYELAEGAFWRLMDMFHDQA